jgi:hypothetical protein
MENKGLQLLKPVSPFLMATNYEERLFENHMDVFIFYDFGHVDHVSFCSGKNSCPTEEGTYGSH